jgi:CheY-like chemotaxis protein
MNRKHQILVVDDEHSVTILLSRVLTHAGFDVLTASDGETAFSLLERHPVDLLFVDKCLPRMDGYEVIRRAREQLPGVPAILISAYPSLDSLPPVPVQGYLSKPFRTLRDIEQAARKALGADSARLPASELDSRAESRFKAAP